ncbi:MAG: hypothetical protein P8X74_14590 [Reinekea sp.]
MDENGNRIPLGFNNLDEFRQFTNVSSEGLPKGAHIVFKGSSVTDKSCKSFDDRRVSDFDIGLVSDDLFIESLDLGRDFGFKVKTQPDRIGPLEPTQLELLNLKDLQTTLSEKAGRPVNFQLPSGILTRLPGNNGWHAASIWLIIVAMSDAVSLTKAAETDVFRPLSLL